MFRIGTSGGLGEQTDIKHSDSVARFDICTRFFFIISFMIIVNIWYPLWRVQSSKTHSNFAEDDQMDSNQLILFWHGVT